MRRSVSLSNKVDTRLGELVAETDTNPSVVVETALAVFDGLSPSERKRLAQATLAEKRPRSRSGWRRLFWELLAEEMGGTDFGKGHDRFLMVPRPYCGFNVIFDASADLAGDDGNEVIVFTDTAPPYTPETVRLSETWRFHVGGKPISEAAHDVAVWLRENEPKLHTK
jgi:hypothetical protein